MPKIHSYTITAALPESLSALRDLTSNLWWTWNPAAKNLFDRIRADRPTQSKINPVALINSLSSEEIKELEQDPGFLAQLKEVVDTFEQYRSRTTWWNEFCQREDLSEDTLIAYFSLEFGLHESLPIYSGGLGVLAGDHLKGSSDMGVPLIGIGLLYYEGYFSQYLNADGWQQESYNKIDPALLPITPVLDKDGSRLRVHVDIGTKRVAVQGWKVSVGTVSLYLLDTNIDENDDSSRLITSRLYGGDAHARIQQEIVLGVAGVRFLDAMGITPDVHHMNEGHSAFISIEQIRRLMGTYNLSFKEALVGTKSGNHFTTHTPVPAGNDVFPRGLIEEYFSSYVAEMGIEMEDMLRLGRMDESNKEDPFSMTVLAIKTSRLSNGVSELHGHVSRGLWDSLWPGLPLNESPIQHVTNGIHTTTWASRDISELFDRFVGPAWREQTSSPDTWRAVSQIPDEEIWRIRDRSRSLLVSYCRERLRSQLIRRGAGKVELENASSALNPDALTIGFARRFASYKRAALLLTDLDRLTEIVNNSGRPVQFIFAGKAHPADHIGKEIITRIIHSLRKAKLAGRFVFLEDYDMEIARRLVQGVDVWLNNPRRPHEACGTSGMKVAVNGGLNFSVLDGWWCESFDGANGWSIGQGEEYESTEYQDQVESRSIYDTLEREIVPLFFDRNGSGYPGEWLRLVKHSIRTITPKMSAVRMVQDYATDFYAPASTNHKLLSQSDYNLSRKYAETISHFRSHWQEIRILDVCSGAGDNLNIGDSLPVSVTVNLGPFKPDEVAVQVLSGALSVTNDIQHGSIHSINNATHAASHSTTFTFSDEIRADRAGRYGLSVRVVPIIGGEPVETLPSLITWWE
jgi:starch phosphorylase